MDLSLSPAEQLRLQEAVRTLVSPLEYPEVDGWRSAVNGAVRELLGADMASFMLPGTGTHLVHSDELPPNKIDDYPSRLATLRRIAIWRRQVALGAWTRSMFVRPFADAYYRSAYYNDYLVPLRCHHSIGVTISLDDGSGTERYAGLLFHRDHPGKRPFGRRGLAVLHLLLPAFRSGVRVQRVLSPRRDELARSLDGLGVAVAVFDARTGRRLHHCPPLASILERDPERERLEAELRSSALAAGTVDARGFTPVAREVRTRGGGYRIRVTRAPGSLGREDTVLVLLEPTAPDLPSDAEMRERFGITRAEAHVARLLAEGRSNAEVAEALFISPHTAERHTESILRKLGIHSRAAVASALSRPHPRPGEGVTR
jgi:DNA-binding CsgD family transcriptional regulator